MALPVNNVSVFNEQGVRQRGGFFPGIFPEGFDTKFKCLHCHFILRDPYQGTCGHRFCRSCSDEILRESNTVNCPACIEEPNDESEMAVLAIERMFPDNGVKREMSLIVTKCMFPSCQWKGYFKEYENHEQNCPFKQVACALCAQPVLDGHIEQHRSKQCSQRQVNCEHCNAQIVFAALKTHNETCQKFPVKCEACGKSNIPRESFKNHMEQLCPKRNMSCPMGCLDQFSLDKFSDHLQLSVELHLAWTVQKMAALEQKIQDTINSVGVATPASLNQVKMAVTGIEKKLQTVERQLQQVVQKTSSATPEGQGSSSSGSGGQDGGGATSDPEKSSEMAAKASLQYIEPILGVMHGELKRAQLSIQNLEAQHRQQQAHTDEVTEQFNIRLQQQLRLKDAAIADLELRLAAQEMVRYDGTILWKVTDFSTKKKEAMSGHTTSLYSPAFYSGHCGYKMCARIYPNGDGVGKGTHISLFFVIMKGHYDALLPWPFSQKVTLMMIDQNHKEHIVDAFKPDITSTSFKRPVTEMNIASGCPLFLPLEKLYNSNYGYLRDETIFVKIIVDTEGLERYTEMNPGRIGFQ